MFLVLNVTVRELIHSFIMIVSQHLTYFEGKKECCFGYILIIVFHFAVM